MYIDQEFYDLLKEQNHMQHVIIGLKYFKKNKKNNLNKKNHEKSNLNTHNNFNIILY